MFIYLHNRELPYHQGVKYPILINLNHIESVRNYCGHALLWFHDDTGEERSFCTEESFESVVSTLDDKGMLIKRDEGKLAALVDDSVPRLVLHAAEEDIANKDQMLKEMAEALQHMADIYYGRDNQPIAGAFAKQMDAVLQKYKEQYKTK